MLSFVDADALVAENWLSESVGPINSGTAVVAVPNWKIIAFGICTVKTSLFHKVRGFDESFRGWGYEDNDFMQRIEQYGAVFRYDSNLVEMINHAPELRMQFYSAKDFMVSRNENMDRLANRRGRVNPHGYGVGDMVHFATPADTEPAVQA